MKLLAYSTNTQYKSITEVEPQCVVDTIQQIFSCSYNRILAKWQGDMFIIERVEDTTESLEASMPEPSFIPYTKTKINYHPLMEQL